MAEQLPPGNINDVPAHNQVKELQNLPVGAEYDGPTPIGGKRYILDKLMGSG
ncbi:MAG: hypothetical protein Fur0021_16630 [Candidatus Promineifilaceae bacterium]